MNCTSAQALIERLLDDELEPGPASQLQEHLADCPTCADLYAQERDLRSDIRSQAPYYSAPAGLEASIRSALRETGPKVSAPPREAYWRWGAIAATVLLGASLTWNFAMLHTRISGSEMIATQVLSSHVRSLIGNHLVDVTSSDQHTVKPWFAGKLDFAPDVKDLAQQGYPLLGGRIEYLSGQNAAALVYGRRKHVINLFIWPVARADNGPSELTEKGYHLLHWSDDQMTYWAVSDVAVSDLEQFKTLYRR